MKRIALTAAVTACACFGIAAATGLGSSTPVYHAFTLRAGDSIRMPEIAWTCHYVTAKVGNVFNCNPTAPGVLSPLVIVQQSKVVVFGDLPSIQRAGSGGFSTFRVK
jgi:hypothetical protein